MRFKLFKLLNTSTPITIAPESKSPNIYKCIGSLYYRRIFTSSKLYTLLCPLHRFIWVPIVLLTTPATRCTCALHLLELQIEPNNFTPRVWNLPLLWFILFKFNLTLSRPGCKIFHRWDFFTQLWIDWIPLLKVRIKPHFHISVWKFTQLWFYLLKLHKFLCRLENCIIYW